MIGIIGYGFVGQALGSVLQTEFKVVDPKHSDLSIDELLDLNPDTIFVCVPTPSTSEGCDDSIIMSVVKSLARYNGTVVVKSTVPPSTVDKLLSIRPSIVIWPELLRELHSKEDMKQPSLIVIGSNSHDDFSKLFYLILEKTNIEINTGRIRKVSPVEASMFKYTVNSFLAMKVVFMHEMHLWATERGENWDNVADILALEGRVGSSHLRAPGVHGFGFDGTCFPKDTQALAMQARYDGAELSLLEQAIEINKKLQKLSV